MNENAAIERALARAGLAADTLARHPRSTVLNSAREFVSADLADAGLSTRRIGEVIGWSTPAAIRGAVKRGRRRR